MKPPSRCTRPTRPTRPSLWIALIGLAPFALASAHAADAIAGLQVREAWIRWLPANLPAAGYLTLANNGDRPLALIGVSTPAYGEVGLHRTVTAGGTSKMLPVERITIAPHSVLSFAATGYHLMLMQPVRPLAPGAHVVALLHFAGGGSQAVQFEVRKPNGSAASGAEGMAGMPGMQH